MINKIFRSKNAKIFIMSLELIICLVITILPFFGAFDSENNLILPSYLVWAPLTFFGICSVLTFFEFLFSKPFIRAGYVFLSLILIAALGHDSLAFLNSIIWLLGLLYIPFLVGCLIGYLVNSKRKKQTNEIPLKPGLYCKEQYLIITRTSLLLILLSTSCTVCLNLFFDFSIWKSLLVFLPIVLLIIFIVTIKADPIIKASSIFRKTACYKMYVETLDSLLKENIHEDTVSLLNCYKVDAMFEVDSKTACALFETIKKPKYKNYVINYDVVEIEYYISKKDFDKANNLLSVFKSKKPKHPAITILENSIIIESTEQVIENIEVILSINSPYKLNNLVNANNLMIYYYKRNQSEKAKEYAEFILEQNTDLEELNKNAKEILENVHNA